MSQETCRAPEMIPMQEIFCDHDFNCRGFITPLDVSDLVPSIETHGLCEPITVQPWNKIPGKKWRIIMGHRRFTACMVLKKQSIACFIRDDLDDIQAHTLNLIENINRKALNIMQEAKGIEFYKNAGFTQDETAVITKLSRGWVQTRFMVLEFPEDIQKEIAAGFVNQTQIRDLHGLPHEEVRQAIHEIKTRREKGEKAIDMKAKKKKGNAKRERRRGEIFEIQEIIYPLLGPGFHTRLLAWAAGEITDFDIQSDIREEAKKIGKTYLIPMEYLQ